MNDIQDASYLRQISTDTFQIKTALQKCRKKTVALFKVEHFRQNREIYGVFCCDQCEMMEGGMKLKLDSCREVVDQLLCCHSKTASFLLPNWQEVWNIEVPRFVTAFQPKINQELNYHKFQDRTKDETLLVGVWVDNSPHLMLTMTKRQSTPFCSTCDALTCPHYKFYLSRQKDENILVSNFNSSMGVNENGNNLINIEVASH
jgi:hypothetical protein